MWHDHGKIADQGQFLFLVSGIYDPAFYVTPDELQNRGQDVDVINIVERPEVHIIARSGSADIDQISYTECWIECALELGKSLETCSGITVTDVVCFFSMVTTQHNNLRLEITVEVTTHVFHAVLTRLSLMI